MKTSRANSFRLHRIAKTSSTRKQSQTMYNPDESFKLAAISSVTKGVKYNQLSFMTGRDLNKLRKEPVEGDDRFYESAHQSLTEVRKKYDDMMKQRVNKEESITRLKEQITKFSIFSGEHSGKINTAKERSDELEEDIKSKKELFDEKAMDKRVLLNVQARLNSDKVVYDHRKFNGEKELGFLRKQLDIISKEGATVGESADRTGKVFQKLVKQLEAQETERKQHLEHLEDMIEKREKCLEANRTREQEIAEIAERAMQDKDQNEKEWRKILATHSFVNKMLRNMIEKEMEKFKVVEFAFKEIKTATGVNDAKTLVQKYLNKETVYGELLGKISENEKRIEALKGETDQLIKESRELELQKDVIHSVKVKSLDLHDDLKELNFTTEKALHIQNLKAKMRIWLTRQQKKLATLGDGKVGDNSQNLRDMMNIYFENIMLSLEKAQGEITQQQKNLGSLSNKEFEKIFRIIPKKFRKNSIGQEIFDVGEEEVPNAVLFEEQEILSHKREEILKGNEKFMRELKKKKDEMIKLLVERAEKKDKVKVEPKKKEEGADQ